jgi:hypothetical protein
MTLSKATFLATAVSRRRALRLGVEGAALYASPPRAAICPPDPGSAGQSAVETAIKTALSQGDIASISYALISCGKVFAVNAYGTASPNVAASSATLYQAASISKTLAAVGGLYAMQCERLHARFRRHRFSNVVETAERNDRRHVATASRHDGGGECAWLSGLCAILHGLDEL